MKFREPFQVLRSGMPIDLTVEVFCQPGERQTYWHPGCAPEFEAEVGSDDNGREWILTAEEERELIAFIRSGREREW